MYWKGWWKKKYPAKLHLEDTISHVCTSCTIYIILFSLFFTINIGVGTVFIYFYWFKKTSFLNLLTQQFTEPIKMVKEINIKNKSYYFFIDMVTLKRFWWKKIESRQKELQKHWYLLRWLHQD